MMKEVVQDLTERSEESLELWPDWTFHDIASAHKALLSFSIWPKNRLLKWNTTTVPLKMISGCFQN
jgi:hypothetical protein